ncbi:MAG: hypothetical protein E8D40_01050 [Nitrospira sp.]|nr:MAG: hypothetical protein E8D40_01050 [Nitrospira sp.]
MLHDLHLSATDYQTFLLLEEGHVYTKSAAVPRVIRQLSRWWPLILPLCAGARSPPRYGL